MDNYGNDYFMSQEGYASIDFTLLDRPNSNIASAPESTAALLPDLHVGDASFSSFDFLDGPGVDTFGTVLRDADEAHSRDHNGYRGEQDKYRKDASEHDDAVALHRGDGDSDTELPSSGFHVSFEKPISNLDFFSQGHTKDSGQQGQQGQQGGSDSGNDGAEGGNDYFESSAHARSGGGGWSTGWAGTNSQGDQTQVFFQTPSPYEETSAQKRLLQEYNSLSNSHAPDNNPAPRATHSFLPTAKQNDSRQASNTGLNHPNAQMSAMSASKSNPRNQHVAYDGAMNGSGSQMRQNLASEVENATNSRRFQAADDANLARGDMGTTDGLRNHTHSQNFKYGAQQVESLGSVEASPLKNSNYFLGGQYGTRVPAQMEAGQQSQLAVDEMQAWQQQSFVPQSNQQQGAFQQSYQDLSRQGTQQQQVEQQTHNIRQQNFQQLLGVNHGHPGFGNQQLSPFLSDSSLQDLPRMAERQQSSQLTAVDNQRATLLQPNYQQLNNANLSWSANDPSTMQVLAHEYLMGPDHSFNWQALALKASQLEPSMYGNMPATRRDPTGQPLPAYNTGAQSGLQEYYSGAGKLTAPTAADAGRHLARNLGSGDSGGAVYGGEYQSEVYDAAANLQATAQHSKHQALGKMPFWQNPYPQSTEQNRGGSNIPQSSLPPRSPQVPAPSQVRPQRAWSGLPNHQESLRGGLFTQNLTNTEALKQSLISGDGVHPNNHSSANVRPSSRSQNLDAAQYIPQGATQAASSSQLLDALGRKQQSTWKRMSMQQQNVPQGGVSPENPSLESNQKGNWTALNAQHVAADSQSLSSLKQQNMWSGHSAHQSSASPVSSLHLFADVDARRSNIHGGHNLHQGTSQSSGNQQMGKVDTNPQNNHSIQSGTGPGIEASNMSSNLDPSQQHNEWRDHGIQAPSQNVNSLQSYNELDKTSNWRNIWQTPSAAEGSSQLLDMDDGRRESNLWSHNLQKSSSHAVESRTAAVNSREPGLWTAQAGQQETRQTNQLLSNRDGQAGNHHSQSLSERHPSSRFGHYTHEEAGRPKSAVEVDARHNDSQHAYSLQSQVGRTDGDMRGASQNAYNSQIQAGAIEPDSRHKTAQNLYHLQTQAGLGQTDTTHKGSLAAYSLQQQLATGESNARHAGNQSIYGSRAQAAAGDSNAGNSGLNSFNLQSQTATGDEDQWHRSTIQDSYSLQSQMGAMDIDAQRSGTQNAYDLQSQVGMGEDVRQKNNGTVYSLHSPLGAHTQSGNVDGRHSVPHWSHSTQQHGNSQSTTSMYAFPSMTAKEHGSQNLRSVQAWNATVDNVDGWQAASGTGGRVLLQPTGLSQVNSSDARHQQAQSGINSQHSNPQADSHLRSLNTRPQSRMSRLNNSQEASVFGSMGPSVLKSSVGNHWHQQQHARNTSATSGSHGDFPLWSQGHGLSGRDANKIGIGEEPKTGSADGLPAWSRGQSFPAQQSMDHVSVGSAPVGGRSEVPQPWQRGQSVSAQEDPERFNLGEDSRTAISDAHRQWSRGKAAADQQSLVEGGDFVRDASGGGMDDGTRPTWSRQQKLSSGSELEQHNVLGDSNNMSDEILPDWSRSQSTIPHLDELNRSKSSENGAKEAITWSHGQQHLPTRNSDNLNVEADSASARADVSNWSHQSTAPSRTDTEQFNFAGEADIGEDEGASSWSQGHSGGKPFDHPNMEQNSSGGKFDQSHAENVLSQKDVEQLNQAGDGNHGGVTVQAKDHLYPRLEAEKRAQAERRFLDGGTTRESNSLASPAPSPESALFSSAAKQKSGPKASSLSKNTLDLLSKPEDPDDLSSMNDEDNEVEGDMEDSGANASSISLAHLRRNQASGPLSPQGFGLRLAPPSHLSQHSQGGNSSRLIHSASNLGGGESGRLLNAQSNIEQSHPVATGNADGADKRGPDNEQLDPSIPTAYGISSLVPDGAMSAGATADSHQDSHPRVHEASSDIHESSSGGTHKTDGNTSQKSVSASPANVGTSQSVQAMPSSGESGQLDSVKAPSAQIMDPAAGQIRTVDEHAMNNVLSPSRANAIVNATANSPSGPQFSSNVNAQHSVAEQPDPLSKLLSTFKDSLSGPSQQMSVQQQVNNLDRGSAGLFESLRTPAGKQVNGFQPPTPWTGDSTSMSAAMKDELLKRYAVQSKANQPGAEYLSALNATSQQSPAGSGALQRQTAGTGQVRSGQLAYAQGANFAVQTDPPGQSRPRQPLNRGQPFPGLEATVSPSHSDQRHNQSYDMGTDGLVLPDGHDISGQAMMLDQSQPVASQTSRQGGSTFGQTYSGHAFPNGQAIPGQANLAGLPYHMYNSSRVVAPPDIMTRLGQNSSSGPSFPNSPVPSFQSDSRLETPAELGSGRASGHSTLGKLNKANQRKLSRKAAGRDLSKMLDKSAPHQAVGFAPSPGGHETDQEAPGPQSLHSLVQNRTLPSQYDVGPESNDLSSSAVPSQENLKIQAASMAPVEPASSEERGAGDNVEVLKEAEKSKGAPGSVDVKGPSRQSGIEQLPVQQDNQGDSMLQQLGAPSWNASFGLTDYQFQKILEARPQLLAGLEMHKGNPRFYSIALAQLRNSLGQASMAKQLGLYQQHAREQVAASASTTVAKPLSDGPATSSGSQGSQMSQALLLQGAQGTQVRHTLQAFQTGQSSQLPQSDVNTAQAMKAFQAAQALQTGQVPSGQLPDQTSEAVKAAVICQNASTAARLQFLAQRGQNGHGMGAPWFSGLGSRSGITAPLASRYTADGRNTDSVMTGAALDRLRHDDLSGSRSLTPFYPPPLVKKRKEPPVLIPWRDAISQAGGYASSMSSSELEWAHATNRIADTEPYDDLGDAMDSKGVFPTRVRRRLRLTTQLMQQITPAVPQKYMKSNTTEDREDATYIISKLAFTEACRFASIARRIKDVAAARDAEESRIEREKELAMKEAEKSAGVTKRVVPERSVTMADKFKSRMNQLEDDLRRLETSRSAVDLVKDMQDTERVNLVNRITVYHSLGAQNAGFPSKQIPQKYVTPVNPPDVIPEGLSCVPL